MLKLGMMHEGKYYLNKSLAFRAAIGMVIFQCVSDAIHRILALEGLRVWNCTDDIFACVQAENASRAFNRLVEIIEELDVPILPGQSCTAWGYYDLYGVKVNAGEITLKLLPEKIGEILPECEKFRHWKGCGRAQLQSAFGKLLYFAKIVILALAFLNRILWDLGGCPQCQYSSKVVCVVFKTS